MVAIAAALALAANGRDTTELVGTVQSLLPRLAELAGIEGNLTCTSPIADQVVYLRAPRRRILVLLKDVWGLEIVKRRAGHSLERPDAAKERMAREDGYRTDIETSLRHLRGEAFDWTAPGLAERLSRRASRPGWTTSSDLAVHFLASLPSGEIQRMPQFHTVVYSTEPMGRQQRVPSSFRAVWSAFTGAVASREIADVLRSTSTFFSKEQLESFGTPPRAAVVKVFKSANRLAATVIIYDQEGRRVEWGRHEAVTFAALKSEGVTALLDRKLDFGPPPRALSRIESRTWPFADLKGTPNFEDPLLDVASKLGAAMPQGDGVCLVLSDFHVRALGQLYGVKSMTVRRALEAMGARLPVIVERKGDVLFVRPQHRLDAEARQAPRAALVSYIAYLGSKGTEEDLGAYCRYAIASGSALFTGLWNWTREVAASSGVSIYIDPPTWQAAQFMGALGQAGWDRAIQAGLSHGWARSPTVGLQLGQMLDNLWPQGAPEAPPSTLFTEPSAVPVSTWAEAGGFCITGSRMRVYSRAVLNQLGSYGPSRRLFSPGEALDAVPQLAQRASSADERLRILMDEEAFFVGQRLTWTLAVQYPESRLLNLRCDLVSLQQAATPVKDLPPEAHSELLRALGSADKP